jgi:hypothetical protein
MYTIDGTLKLIARNIKIILYKWTLNKCNFDKVIIFSYFKSYYGNTFLFYTIEAIIKSALHDVSQVA